MFAMGNMRQYRSQMGLQRPGLAPGKPIILLLQFSQTDP